MQSSNFELDVLIHGSKARTYQHEGKVYIEGKEGSKFTVCVKNNTPNKVLAVLTVDGLSVIDGSEASFKSGGYILDPWSSVKVPGWRLNNKEVAAFEFTESKDSYAAKKSGLRNIGVIGCAFYFERAKDFTYLFHVSNTTVETSFKPDCLTSTLDNKINTLCVNEATAFNCASIPTSNSIGTGFGDKTNHKVVETTFESATSAPSEVLTIYYDSKNGLKSRGVDLDWVPQISPSAFPKEPSMNKYCKPPVDWKG